MKCIQGIGFDIYLLQALGYDLGEVTSLEPKDLDFTPLGTTCTPIQGAEVRWSCVM